MRLAPGFMVLQGNLLEDLRDVAVQWLRTHPLGALENETILVQSNGIAQWLKIALAQDESGQGVAAALDIQLPGRFVWQAFRSVFADLPRSSPFDKQPLSWRIYLLLRQWEGWQERLGEQAQLLQPLAGFLRADTDPRRAYQLASRLADLYDQYQLYRADWLLAWEQGEEVLIDAAGARRPLPPEQRWQALLWRELSALIAGSSQAAPALEASQMNILSRAHVHARFIDACARLTTATRPPGLPRRVIVFSISSLPQQILQVLQAISPFTQVMVFANNPCQHYWGDLVEGKALLKQAYRRMAPRSRAVELDPAALHAEGHPLLASWGKQGRDYLHLLDEHDEPDNYRQLFAQQRIDLFRAPGEDSLLHQLQSDILALRSLAERQQLASPVDPAQDDSLQFIVAHSAQREVEILHDQLLASFAHARAAGKPLKARDILVMVPDINNYAPHIDAVFGRYATLEAADGQRDPRYLPYHIADQRQREQNSLLLALEQLLTLPQSRFAASELLELLDTPAVRARFDLSEQDLPLLRRWIDGAQIRWGLDGAQRGELALPALEQNTWLSGLQRMLLGYAIGAAGCWQGVEAYAEVAGLDAALLGPLSALLDALQQARLTLAQTQLAADWPAVLSELLDNFFRSSSAADSWALGELAAGLELLEQSWHESGLANEQLPLEVVREEWLGAFDQNKLSQKFLGGAINFATLMPMRAIPFAQLWLLGMNEQDYPRTVAAPDFDLMAQDYRPGDRSRREDDRYLFLEALLSARERLVISWVGRDIRDDSPRPPSVLVSQLRDHLAAGWSLASDTAGAAAATGGDLLAALTTVHPLQPFSPRYFLPGRDPRLLSYAHEWRQVHAALGSSAEAATQDLDCLPRWQPQTPIRLSELTSFLRNPVQHFYQQRLGVRWLDEAEHGHDSELFHPDGLQAWQLNAELLESSLLALATDPQADAVPVLQAAVRRLQRSGALPMAAFAGGVAARLSAELAPPLARHQQLQQRYPEFVPARTQRLAAAGLVLEDLVSDLRRNDTGDSDDSGHTGECERWHLLPGTLHDGKALKYHHLIRQWPAHLWAQLVAPVATRLLAPGSEIVLPALAAERAQALLEDLLAAYVDGMSRPLPLPCRTAFAELSKPGSGQAAYEGDFNRAGECLATPGLQALWPDYASLSAEADFSHYAERLYRPLLELLP